MSEQTVNEIRVEPLGVKMSHPCAGWSLGPRCQQFATQRVRRPEWGQIYDLCDECTRVYVPGWRPGGKEGDDLAPGAARVAAGPPKNAPDVVEVAGRTLELNQFRLRAYVCEEESCMTGAGGMTKAVGYDPAGRPVCEAHLPKVLRAAPEPGPVLVGGQAPPAAAAYCAVRYACGCVFAYRWGTGPSRTCTVHGKFQAANSTSAEDALAPVLEKLDLAYVLRDVPDDRLRAELDRRGEVAAGKKRVEEDREAEEREARAVEVECPAGHCKEVRAKGMSCVQCGTAGYVTSYLRKKA